LYEELKILPGHTVKLDRIIDTLAKSSYSLQGEQALDYAEVESQLGERKPRPIVLGVMGKR
jgi:glycine/serine hydroxymethyltransferase